jgi:hypothetical protein
LGAWSNECLAILVRLDLDLDNVGAVMGQHQQSAVAAGADHIGLFTLTFGDGLGAGAVLLAVIGAKSPAANHVRRRNAGFGGRARQRRGGRILGAGASRERDRHGHHNGQRRRGQTDHSHLSCNYGSLLRAAPECKPHRAGFFRVLGIMAPN